MFPSKTYAQRRNELKKKLENGVIVMLGNEESPMNYRDNAYHFRQDSSFLYYFGLNDPGLTAVIDIDSGSEVVYGYDFTMDDVVWMGSQESLAARAEKCGVNKTAPSEPAYRPCHCPRSKITLAGTRRGRQCRGAATCQPQKTRQIPAAKPGTRRTDHTSWHVRLPAYFAAPISTGKT